MYIFKMSREDPWTRKNYLRLWSVRLSTFLRKRTLRKEWAENLLYLKCVRTPMMLGRLSAPRAVRFALFASFSQPSRRKTGIDISSMSSAHPIQLLRDPSGSFFLGNNMLPRGARDILPDELRIIFYLFYLF